MRRASWATTATRFRSSRGGCWTLQRWSPRTGTAWRDLRGSTRLTSSFGREWGRKPRCRSSTAARSVSKLSDRLHLAQPCEALERLGLDLAHALAGEAEPAADLLERLRLLVDEPVAQDQDL